MMDPPKVLLELSFLRALADRNDQHHVEASELYLALLAQYEAERVLLVAVSDHLRALRTRRAGPLAPVDALHVGHQHRRAARRSAALMATADIGRALTLVMCERHRVRRVATFDPHFRRYQLELTPATADGE